MDINELGMRIQKKHRDSIAAFRAKIFGSAGHSGPHNENDLSRRLPYLGPVRSLLDGRVDLTLGGDLVYLDWYMQDASMAGTCVTISIAGHHRIMGGRTSLPSGECDAWVQAIMEPAWMDKAYRAGTLSGVNNQLSTVYYRFFFDESNRAMDRPENFNHPKLRPMSEL